MIPPPIITRTAIVTLDDGAKIRMEIIVPTTKLLMNPGEFERNFIMNFNRSQPNMVHKVVGMKLMRN